MKRKLFLGVICIVFGIWCLGVDALVFGSCGQCPGDSDRSDISSNQSDIVVDRTSDSSGLLVDATPVQDVSNVPRQVADIAVDNSLQVSGGQMNADTSSTPPTDMSSSPIIAAHNLPYDSDTQTTKVEYVHADGGATVVGIDHQGVERILEVRPPTPQPEMRDYITESYQVPDNKLPPITEGQGQDGLGSRPTVDGSSTIGVTVDPLGQPTTTTTYYDSSGLYTHVTIERPPTEDNLTSQVETPPIPISPTEITGIVAGAADPTDILLKGCTYTYKPIDNSTGQKTYMKDDKVVAIQTIKTDPVGRVTVTTTPVNNNTSITVEDEGTTRELLGGRVRITEFKNGARLTRQYEDGKIVRETYRDPKGNTHYIIGEPTSQANVPTKVEPK